MTAAKKRGSACFLALAFFCSAPAAADNGTGDFAPLAVGNAWVYSLQVTGGGFWWNPSVQHMGRRTVRVESRTDGPEGLTSYVLSFRDSLYSRWRTADQGTTDTHQRPDTVKSGLFQITETAGNGRLSMQAMGYPIPAGMELLFRRRSRTGILSVRTTAGDSLDVVSVSAHYHYTMQDSAVYARNLGLIFFRRNYDLLGEAQIPGYAYSTCQLVSFNGQPVSRTPSLGPVPAQPQVAIFSGLKQGRSWRYRGLRQQVLGTSSRNIRRDSVDREVTVTRVQQNQGLPEYGFSYTDRLYRRTFNGQSRPDTLETGGITVSHTAGKPFFTVAAGARSQDTQDDLSMLFKWNSLPEEALVMREIAGVDTRVSEYRESVPGLLEDTLVHAEGIGLVRRTRLLSGIVPGFSEHIDLHLVALDGKPFGPLPVAIGRGLSDRAPGRKPTSPPGMKTYPLRDILGRFREASIRMPNQQPPE